MPLNTAFHIKCQNTCQRECHRECTIKCQIDSCQEVEYQIQLRSMCEFTCQNSFRIYVETMSVVGDSSKKVFFDVWNIYIYIDMGCAFCCEAPFYPSQNHIVWIPLVTSWFLHSMKYSCKYRESELEELFAPA